MRDRREADLQTEIESLKDMLKKRTEERDEARGAISGEVQKREAAEAQTQEAIAEKERVVADYAKRTEELER